MYQVVYDVSQAGAITELQIDPPLFCLFVAVPLKGTYVCLLWSLKLGVMLG